MTTTIPTDGVAVVPVSFTDQFGRAVAAPAGATPVSATAGVDTLAFDGTNLTITPTTAGSDDISFAGLSGSLAVTIEAPVATSVVFGTATITEAPSA